VTVRTAAPADLPALIALARDPAVAPFLATIAPRQLEAAFDDPDDEPLVLEIDGAFAGGARLSVYNARSAIVQLNTVMLDPRLRGRGLGAAAVRALAARAFARGAHRVQAEVLGRNEAALRTFAAAGFTREGVRRAAWRRDGGEWQDGVHVGLLAHELPG
jgi:RimJ/RimL family protein N-acetyltransferase